MPVSKKLSKLKEPLDIDYQLMATELDTSIKNMKYISSDLVQDEVSVDAFNSLVKDIESGEGVEITSFDDNTILYEYLENAVVVHTADLCKKFVLFDSMITQRIENKMDSYKEI